MKKLLLKYGFSSRRAWYWDKTFFTVWDHDYLIINASMYERGSGWKCEIFARTDRKNPIVVTNGLEELQKVLATPLN